MLRSLFLLSFLAFHCITFGQQLQSYKANEVIFLDEYETECLEDDAYFVRVFEYDKGTQLYIARDYSINDDNKLVEEHFYSEVHPNKEVKTVYYNLKDGTKEVITYEEDDMSPTRCVKTKNNKEVSCDKTKDGEYTEYYNEGYSKGVAVGNYKKGKRIGEWKYEIGGREIYTNYNNKGVLEGLEYEIQTYDKQRQYERTYRNNKLNGWSSKWHTTGAVDELGGVESRIKYRDNAPIDTAFWYYPNGQKEVQLIFYPNEAKVWKQTWYKSGAKSSEGWQAYEGTINPKTISQWSQFSHYADKNGSWKMWHKNGKLSSEISYKKGIQDGKATRYYDNGKKSYEAIFAKGLLEDKAKTWHSNGQLKSEGLFINGTKVGKWTYLDKEGKAWSLNDNTIFAENFEAPMNLSNPAYYVLKLQLLWMAEAVHKQDWDTGIKLCSRAHLTNQFGYTHRDAYQGVQTSYYGSEQWQKFRNGYMISLFGLNYVNKNIGGDITLIDRIVYDSLSQQNDGFIVYITVYLHDGTTMEGRMYIDGKSFRFFSSFG